MNKIILALILVLVNTSLMAQSFSYEVEDDQFSNYLMVTGSEMETIAGNSTIKWKLLGQIDRRTGQRFYSIMWWSMYRQNSINLRNYSEIILPGAIRIDGLKANEDRRYVNRMWLLFEIWTATIPESQLITIDEFRFRATDGPNVDTAMPPGYVEGLIDVMMEYSE